MVGSSLMKSGGRNSTRRLRYRWSWKGQDCSYCTNAIVLGDHFEIKAIDADENEWLIHSTNGVKLGQRIGLFFDPEDIHVMRLNESQADFDARIEKYEGDENED